MFTLSWSHTWRHLCSQASGFFCQSPACVWPVWLLQGSTFFLFLMSGRRFLFAYSNDFSRRQQASASPPSTNSSFGWWQWGAIGLLLKGWKDIRLIPPPLKFICRHGRKMSTPYFFIIKILLMLTSVPTKERLLPCSLNALVPFIITLMVCLFSSLLVGVPVIISSSQTKKQNSFLFQLDIT